MHATLAGNNHYQSRTPLSTAGESIDDKPPPPLQKKPITSICPQHALLLYSHEQLWKAVFSTARQEVHNPQIGVSSRQVRLSEELPADHFRAILALVKK